LGISDDAFRLGSSNLNSDFGDPALVGSGVRGGTDGSTFVITMVDTFAGASLAVRSTTVAETISIEFKHSKNPTGCK
jgi:hypothetical protein